MRCLSEPDLDWIAEELRKLGYKVERKPIPMIYSLAKKEDLNIYWDHLR